MKTPLMKHWYHSWLVPYIEGTLDERRRAKLEARLASDPALAAEAEAIRRTVRRLQEASQHEHTEIAPLSAAPSRAWPQIEARLRPTRHTVPRPWLWAGSGLCAASLAWATLWGPLTLHTAYPVKPSAVQAVAEKGPSPATLVPGSRAKRHPRKPSRGSGRTVKHPARVRKAMPIPRPDATDLLANRDGPASTTDGSRGLTDAPQHTPGHLQLTTDIHDVPRATSNQANQMGTGDQPLVSDNGYTATTAYTPLGTAQGPRPTARASQRKLRRRRHRRHHGTEQAAPAQSGPTLPPDTVPQADPIPPMVKHQPDID